MPTYANGHLPEWPIFELLWPSMYSESLGPTPQKGDIRHVIINKDLGERYGQTYMKSAFRTNDRGFRKENESPLFALLTIVKNLHY